MSKHQPRLAGLVSELLRKNRMVRPPVPVDKIAESLGILIRYEPAEDKLSGALIRKSSENVIGVNSSHHPNRQRFTIAHEIGHFVLHKGIHLHVDESFRINLRDGTINWEEIQANTFAAELLMPIEFITRDAERLGRVGENEVSHFARRYQVSQRAMEIRLANLGI